MTILKSHFLVLIIALLLAGCGGMPVFFQRSHDTTCFFLDVGEGSAIFLDSPDLGRILIDTGNPTSQLVSKLAKMGFDVIDRVIVTHPHPDHTGGIYNVVEFLSPAFVHDNGETLSHSDPEQRWYFEKIRRDRRYSMLRAGDRIEAGQSVLEVLAPHRLGGDWNANSLVILVTIGSTKLLLMADSSSGTEKELLQNVEDLSADILQVGHHGSNAGSSETFLAAVRPKYGVISVNCNNINGYPAPGTVKKLEALDVQVLSTCRSGDIIFAVGSGSKTIRLIHEQRDP